MGGLNWNGNRQPKLSYKSEGLERLFLHLIKEKMTNHRTTTKYWIALHKPLFVLSIRISEKNYPH